MVISIRFLTTLTLRINSGLLLMNMPGFSGIIKFDIPIPVTISKKQKIKKYKTSQTISVNEEI